MSLTSPRVVPALLLACGALLAACGSSADTTGAASPTPAASSTATAWPTSAITAGPAAKSDTPCSNLNFGSPLPPKDAPSDVHVYSSPPAMQIDASKLYQATISTARGDIVLCLQPKLAPKTVNNFVVLARNHFYDKLIFHRVVPGFVIQGGDPAGRGQGGPGYQFADEPVQGDYTPGCVAMANAGPSTNGSQFFICTADDSKLAKNYNLFGAVSKGMDVVLQIQARDVMTSVTVQEQA